jgi:large subunit ribosomal protein L28
MARVCQVTGKRPGQGRKYTIRGIAKKDKGIGLNITGTNKRRFLPNLVKKRFWFDEESRFITLKLSTQAMRTIDKKGLAAVVAQMRAAGQKV